MKFGPKTYIPTRCFTTFALAAGLILGSGSALAKPNTLTSTVQDMPCEGQYAVLKKHCYFFQTIFKGQSPTASSSTTVTIDSSYLVEFYNAQGAKIRGSMPYKTENFFSALKNHVTLTLGSHDAYPDIVSFYFAISGHPSNSSTNTSSSSSSGHSITPIAVTRKHSDPAISVRIESTGIIKSNVTTLLPCLIMIINWNVVVPPIPEGSSCSIL